MISIVIQREGKYDGLRDLEERFMCSVVKRDDERKGVAHGAMNDVSFIVHIVQSTAWLSRLAVLTFRRG